VLIYIKIIDNEGVPMIYKCIKCKFVFERKNEPSKCPYCENQNVIEADKAEQQEFKMIKKPQNNN